MLIGNESLFVSLLILSLVRFGGILVGLNLFLQKREDKYILLIIGWLFGCVGPLLGIVTLYDIQPSISSSLWAMFSLLAGSSTVLIIFGALSNFWNFRSNYIILGSVAFIFVAMLLKLVFAVDVSTTFALLVQASFLIFLITVAISQRNLLLRIARSSFYWMVGIAIIGAGHTLGFIFIYKNQAIGFVGTTFLAVLTIIFILYLEYDLSFGKLKESEEYNRTLFDQSPIGLALTSMEGKLVDVNLAYASMIGRTIAETLSLTYWDITPEKYTDQEEKKMISLNTLGHYGPYEKEYIHKDGHFISVRAQGLIIEMGGEKYIWSSIEDVTRQVQATKEKRQMEAHLSHGQKLESIGTLASGVAHEINNPIMGIMNYATLISERLDPSQSQLREFANEIGHETERVATIVNNLLTFSRQEKQSPSPARITDIVDGTLSLIRTIIKRDQITLEVDVPDDLPEIKCRSQQIQQVLMNLLTNARDALNARYPEYDPKKIIAVNVKLFEKEGRRWLRTTVENHGVGIPVEIRERIFDPFYTTKDRATGTGLGLSISLGIVKDHHGELSFESEKGQPTRFYLDLPMDNGWDL